MQTKREIERKILKKLYKQIASKYNNENISCTAPERVIFETVIQAYINERK